MRHLSSAYAATNAANLTTFHSVCVCHVTHCQLQSVHGTTAALLVPLHPNGPLGTENRLAIYGHDEHNRPG